MKMRAKSLNFLLHTLEHAHVHVLNLEVMTIIQEPTKCTMSKYLLLSLT